MNERIFATESAVLLANLQQGGPGSRNVIQSVEQVGDTLFSLHVTGSGADKRAILSAYDTTASATSQATLTAHAHTTDPLAEIGHQGLSFEKSFLRTDTDANGQMSQTLVHVFWSSRMHDEDSVLRFEVWTDPDQPGTLIAANPQTLQVWPTSGSKGSASPTISDDGQYLIVESNYGHGKMRVFRMEDLVSVDGIAVTPVADPVAEFDLPAALRPTFQGGANPLQAIASDGTHIWVVTGYDGPDDVKKIVQMDMTGTVLDVMDFGVGADIAGAWGNLEPESLFFTEDGQLAVSVATGATGQRTNSIFVIGDSLGGQSNDFLQGDVRVNHLYGYNGDDLLNGGSGDDRLYGGHGADTLIGGAGDDYLRDSSGTDLFVGGAGMDTVSYWGHLGGMRVNLSTGTNSGGDRYDSIENILGSNFANDRLTGTNQANHLVGAGGDDRLYGRAGNDTLEGGAGNDYLRDDAGRDVIHGGSGIDTLSYWGHASGVRVNLATGYSSDRDTFSSIENLLGSNKAADHLTGDATANHIRGARGDDTLVGGGGNDSLYGGYGDDLMFGGAGDDYLRDSAGHDYFSGGAGSDTLSYWGHLIGMTVDLETGANSGGDTYDSIENILGSNFANDHLTGDGGANTLNGAGGDDTLAGGHGDDLLIGGTGADVFVFRDGTGQDTIADFHSSADWGAEADQIDLTGLTSIRDFDTLRAHLVAAGDDTLLHLGGNDHVVLHDVDLHTLSADDFLF